MKQESAGSGRPSTPGDRGQEVPRVSVLMAVYNGLPYLTETLDDLLAQTLVDFELIVVDDGSTDGSLATLHAYAARDPRITIIENPVNMRLPASLNRGLEHCRAPLTARADADDRYPPHRLERQVDFMDRHPDIALLSCAVHKIDEEGNRFRTTSFPTEDGQIRVRELFVNSFSHPGAIFRTDLVRELGGYDPHYHGGEDADLWARIRERAKAANLDEPLVHYRVLQTSLMRTQSKLARQHSLSVRQRQLSDYLDRPLDLAEAGALVQVFHARRAAPPSADQVAVARRGFREVLAKARRRESGATVRYFKREVAEAFRSHAFFRSDPPGNMTRTLLLEAILWNPRLALNRPVVKRLTAAMLPDRVVDWIRGLRFRR